MLNRVAEEIQQDFIHFFKLSTDVFWIAQDSGVIIHSNQMLPRILGYDVSEFIEHSGQELVERYVNPEDWENTRRVFMNLFMEACGKVENFENRWKTKAGNEKWFSWSAMPDPSNQHIYIVGRDITQQKESEIALRKSEERFRNAIESMMDSFATGMAIRDESGKIIDFLVDYINEEGSRYTQLDKDEIIGQKLLELFVGINKFPVFDSFCKVVETGEPLLLESLNFKLLKKSNQEVFEAYDMRVMKIGDESIAITWRNITEKKRVEEALKQSEKRFEKVFNASPHMTSIIRLSDDKYIDVNERFLKARGLNREELIGRTPLELGVPIKEWKEIKRLLKKNGTIDNYEATLVKKNGNHGKLLLSADIVDFNGEKCILFAYNDITEIKKIQTEMARLDRLNLTGQLAASIGHEVRNPMTTVRGYLQLLGTKQEFLKYQETLKMMIKEIDRANSIINEYLSLAKSKKVEGKIQNLNSLIENIFPLLQADAFTQNKQIIYEPGDVPELFLNDNEITQLLLNLCRNGLDAMSEKGCLTIRTYREGRKVVLSVEDQGSGIDPQYIEKLGTPFFTTKEDGTGLGLVTCYNIADRHKAFIDVETDIRGTTFYVRFGLPEEID